ncbi:uncharacterized protein B0T15DRAFT_508190 [Chaetomium strumarium]|uniref:Heterokaryon incompatibility domain-containing protein n=1 Tax=Chaetomium strumarium TaxID=1170767 RepID=A0AAJ0H4G5_9PEZI|nr:hypothetical protein B0T15DRAFT_508190 [Chaetomium strumarium]
MLPIRDSTLDTRLCVDCEGLRLGDEGCGGFMATSDNDTPVLKFTRHGRTWGFGSRRFKTLMCQERTDASPDFPKLAETAAAGCAFCGFLRTAVLEANIEDVKRVGEVHMDLYYLWGPRDAVNHGAEGLQALLVDLGNAYDGGDEPEVDRGFGTLRFQIFTRDKAVADWLGLHKSPRREALGASNISFLRKALDFYASSCHPQAFSDITSLPTRLLDLGTDAASQPRLIITGESIAGLIRYAALSYCWGDQGEASAQTKTEPSNLHERLHAIPTGDMSAVMQDAVKHAYFTICAVSSPSCHQGFLDRRRATSDFTFQSSLYPPARGTYTLFSMSLQKKKGSDTFGPYGFDFANSRWKNRGWVYQELALSTRKLLFGQYMVHFECGRRLLPENGEFSGPLVIHWHPAQIANLSREQLYQRFRECVMGYSALTLTYESDRLPAVSGIAKYLFDLTRDKYLAGLWKGDLHHSLLWFADVPTHTLLPERIGALRASTGSRPPSWSWVSQRGFVEYGLPGTTILYEPGRLELLLLSSSCERKNKANYWPAIYTNNWREYGDKEGEEGKEDKTDQQYQKKQEDEVSEEEEELSKDGRSSQGSPSETVSDTSGDSRTIPADVCVLCNNEEHNRHSWGLVIHPAKKAGEYYRVGIFMSLAGKAGGTHLFKDLEDRVIDII